MKHLILVFILSFSAFLMSEGVSFVQYQENTARFYPFDGNEPEDLKSGYPLYPGDRLVTDRNSFLEIVLSDGNLLWVGSFSDIELRAISGTEGYPDKRTYLYLNSGDACLEVLGNVRYNEEPVLGFQEGDFYILNPGLYFLSKTGNGAAKIMIIEGRGEIATSAGSVFLRSGEEALVYNDGYVDRKRLSLKNEFFVQMVENRRSQRMRSQSSQYTGGRFYSSHYVLDGYGSWIYEPEFSLYVWRPTVVVGWTPYYHGYWRWTPHGWFWVSYEPWGYLTYHYGRWVWTPQYGWVWVPGYTWAPAWVYWFWADFYIGWCPMGYYDYWWYYRWDWWWNWPPCWYNDCYFGFKGRVNLTHLQRDFWIFADGRSLGKTNLVIQKDLKIDPKGREGLIYPINLPFGKKDLMKLDEHFAIQKNVIKEDLSPVFKLKDKPSQEAKNLLSSYRETFSKGKETLKIEGDLKNRENIYKDLKPGRSLSPAFGKDKGEGRDNLNPRVLDREKFPKGASGMERGKGGSQREIIPKDTQPVQRDKGVEPRKDIEPKRDIEKPQTEEKPTKRDSSDHYYREPVYNYERKAAEPQRSLSQPSYERIDSDRNLSRDYRTYQYNPPERSTYTPSSSINPPSPYYERKSQTSPSLSPSQSSSPQISPKVYSSPSSSPSQSSSSSSGSSHSSSSPSVSSHSGPSSSSSSSGGPSKISR
ncbi:MAG: DUF6600 domain-containing protein [Thermoanaerobaculia bacterium]